MLRNTLLAFTAAFLVAQNPVPEAKNAEAPKPEATTQAAPSHAETKPVEQPVATSEKRAEGDHEEEAKAEASQPKEDKVMARLGNRIIRESDFETFANLALQPQQRMQMEMIPAAKEQFRKSFMDYLVREAKARKEGLDKNEDIQKKMKMMEAQVLNMELIQRDGQELQKKVVVDDAAIKDYYDKHADEFKTKATFNARHILISVKEGDKEKSEEAAKAKIAKVQEALKAGKKLEELSKEYSDDPGSKDKGGLYENISYGSFVPAFEDAVKNQEIGKVGEPVKSNYGYHIIQVEKRVEAEQKPFDKVKDQAKQKAQNQKQEEVYQAYMDAMRKEVGFVEGPDAAIPELKTAKKPSPKKTAGKVTTGKKVKK